MTAFPSATRASIRAIITLSGYSRWGQNTCSPLTLKSAIAFWPSSEMSQSMNCWPSSFFTRRCLAGLTRMTPYWLNSSLSPWKVGLVLERKPRAAIRHHIGSAGCCCVERGTHALPDRFVPRPSLLLDVDADALPEIDFRNMRAGVVAARDEG